MTDKNQFPIPFLIFQSLQSSILAEAKKLTKDIATTLGKPEGPLWKEIQKEVQSVYLIEQEEPTHEEFECQGYHIKNGVWSICREPVIYGSKFCPRHFTSPCKHPPANLPIYKKIQLEDEKCGYVNEQNEILDETTLKKIGLWSPKKNIAKIFQST